MAKYICKKCNYTVETENLSDNYVCPSCHEDRESFKKVDEDLFEETLDSIIESVVEESLDIKKNKIVNIDKDDNSIKVSDDNKCINIFEDKCINCGQCKKTCEKIANIRYDLNVCDKPICIGCGKCIQNCPTSAITPKYSYKEIMDLIEENKKIVIAIISPSACASLLSKYNIINEKDSYKKINTALSKLGFDYIFNLAFANDLLVLETVGELTTRLISKKNLPIFTSNCPAFLEYMQIYNPKLLNKISQCKISAEMQSELIKNYYCDLKNIDKSKVVTVSITNCTASKQLSQSSLDYVLTTYELEMLLQEEKIKLQSLNETEFTDTLSLRSGCGYLVENSGGLTESIVRTLYRILTKKNLDKKSLEIIELRGMEGIKEATVVMDKYKIKVAVIQQLKYLEELLETGNYKKYNIIEVLACKGGCIAGGGRILNDDKNFDEEMKEEVNYIYKCDKEEKNRYSHDNPDLKTVFKKYLVKPADKKSKELFYKSYVDKSELLKNKNVD